MHICVAYHVFVCVVGMFKVWVSECVVVCGWVYVWVGVGSWVVLLIHHLFVVLHTGLSSYWRLGPW